MLEELEALTEGAAIVALLRRGPQGAQALREAWGQMGQLLGDAAQRRRLRQRLPRLWTES